MGPPPHPCDISATEFPLHLSVNVIEDWIEGVEYGGVIDGRPASQTIELDDEVRLLRRTENGPVCGFAVRGYSTTDLDALSLFEGPRFRVPLLGFDAATVGEIVLTARSRFQVPTADVCFFQRALACADEGEDLEAAASHWLSCAEAGDMRGLFGLGYTLFDLGRHHEAYSQLRRYSELAPHNSWAWLWLGRAAEAVGETAEAADAYRAAISRQNEGSFRTDAAARLRVLERRAQTERSR